MFSCAGHWMDIFPRLVSAACFPALGTRCIFPALGAGSLFWLGVLIGPVCSVPYSYVVEYCYSHTGCAFALDLQTSAILIGSFLCAICIFCDKLVRVNSSEIGKCGWNIVKINFRNKKYYETCSDKELARFTTVITKENSLFFFFKFAVV